jgi:hypothetical protein
LTHAAAVNLINLEITDLNVVARIA